jgi:hypothetical protein
MSSLTDEVKRMRDEVACCAFETEWNRQIVRAADIGSLAMSDKDVSSSPGCDDGASWILITGRYLGKHFLFKIKRF